MPEASLLPDALKTPEVPGSRVVISIDEHFSYFKTPLKTEQSNNLSALFRELHEAGVGKHRYDFKWEDVQPEQGKTDFEQLSRLRTIAETAKKAGLENAIVLAHTPAWALELAKNDPEAFMKAYANYVDAVFDALAPEGKTPIAPATIQIFNELNMRLYTPDILLKYLPECVQMVKDKSRQKFNKDIRILATLSVTTLPLKSIPYLADRPIEFIASHQELLNVVDEIGLDYYTGIWHIPAETRKLYWHNRDYFKQVFEARNDLVKIKELENAVPINMLRKAFGNMDLLEQTIQALQPLTEQGKTISISEVGAPTVIPLENSAMRDAHEKGQDLITRAMSLGLSRLVAKYNIGEVGFYCLTNKPKPEGPFEWGWVRNDGTHKEILGKNGLLRIVDILRHPIKPSAFNTETGKWEE